MATYQNINKNLLVLLSEKHDDWIRMVKSISTNKSIDPEEVVQEMYLRLHKYIADTDKIMYGDEINTMFVYITLRNLYYSFLRDKQKYTTHIASYNHDEEYQDDFSIEEDRMVLQDEILKEVETWHNYDSRLFKIVYYDQVSMRQLSRDTRISLSSIFNTIKKSKEILRSKFQDDYNKLN